MNAHALVSDAASMDRCACTRCSRCQWVVACVHKLLILLFTCLFSVLLIWVPFVAASGEPPLLLAASVHCATREAIRAARNEPHCSGFGPSPSHFDLEVPAIMPVVKELCGLDNVERYLESLLSSE